MLGWTVDEDLIHGETAIQGQAELKFADHLDWTIQPTPPAKKWGQGLGFGGVPVSRRDPELQRGKRGQSFDHGNGREEVEGGPGPGGESRPGPAAPPGNYESWMAEARGKGRGRGSWGGRI